MKLLRGFKILPIPIKHQLQCHKQAIRLVHKSLEIKKAELRFSFFMSYGFSKSIEE